MGKGKYLRKYYHTPNEIEVIDELVTCIIIDSKKFGRKKILIDSEDYRRVKMFRWHLSGQRRPYAKTYISEPRNGAKKMGISLHRLITSFEWDIVDHINMDTLDNRKANLRSVNKSQNAANSPRKSWREFVGVRQIGKKRKITYAGCVEYKGKAYSTKSFKTQTEAALARDVLAFKLFNGKTYLNFPEMFNNIGGKNDQ